MILEYIHNQREITIHKYESYRIFERNIICILNSVVSTVPTKVPGI